MNTCANTDLNIYGNLDSSNQARNCGIMNPNFDCACVKAADVACYEWDLRTEELDCDMILETLPHVLHFSYILCFGCFISSLYCWMIYVSSLCCKNCCGAMCFTNCCILTNDIEDATSSEPLLYEYESQPPPVLVIHPPVYDSNGHHIQATPAVATLPNSPPSYYTT